ncbi:MAG TPA: VOC family protein [Microthrixaceae bacterium]|nr:VOC family protein [Microthrixaceae bacterium]
MEVKELGHAVLYVRNIDRSVAFHRDVLGWRQILPAPDDTGPLSVAVFASRSGRTHHELLLIEVGDDATGLPEGRRTGLYHLGLKVGDSDDELRDALRTVQEAGVPVVGATDHGVTHSLYIHDPDGNELELYIDVPGVDWSDPDNLVMRAPLQL